MTPPKSPAYLRLPVKSKDFFIEEGWLYSVLEKRIHKSAVHRGTDFKLQRGTPIVAAHGGWAIASYHHNYKYVRNKIVYYKGRPVGFGFGYFVQIYNPKNKRWTLYGHLQKTKGRLAFIKPSGAFPRCSTPAMRAPAGFMVKHGTRVKAGEVIGWCGDSGCTWGYGDYPKRPSPKKFPSWDGVHLHFEEFTKDGRGNRRDWRDPFGLYKSFRSYPKSLGKRTNTRGRSWLWL